uniref:hypothetical protein n=1 Tax=Pantanalinema rosaneae TaxID=1620701 RepID=UPI003D6ED3CD
MLRKYNAIRARGFVIRRRSKKVTIGGRRSGQFNFRQKDKMSRSAPAILTRRVFLAGLPLTLTACVSAGRAPEPVAATPFVDPFYASMYGALPDERFPVPAIDVSQVDPMYL